MEVLILPLFVSLLLVLGSVILFAFSAKQRDYDHQARLALFPLDNERFESSSAQPSHERGEIEPQSVSKPARAGEATT